MKIRESIRQVLLSPAPPLFALLWPAIALFLYLAFLGDAGYLTYKAKKAELEHLRATIDELKQDYRDLNDRFLYAEDRLPQSTPNEQIVLFKFENLPQTTGPKIEPINLTEKNRLFFFFIAIFIELGAIAFYVQRRKSKVKSD